VAGVDRDGLGNYDSHKLSNHDALKRLHFFAHHASFASCALSVSRRLASRFFWFFFAPGANGFLG
jgi:hypothetical protein